MTKTFRLTGICSLLALGLFTFGAGTVQAQNYRGSQGYSPAYQSGPSYGGSYGAFQSGPVYHQPSVHNDRVYHPTSTHWTPLRGAHSHGHIDTVPHYTPGHYDYRQGNYLQANPSFHHR